MTSLRCHLCQRILKGDYLETPNGMLWCADSAECYFRARRRLGLPLHVALEAKIRELEQLGRTAQADKTRDELEEILLASSSRLVIDERPCPRCGETTTSVSDYFCAGCHFRGWYGRWADDSAGPRPDAPRADSRDVSRAAPDEDVPPGPLAGRDQLTIDAAEERQEGARP